MEELLFELKFNQGCSFSLIILINQFIYHIPYSDGATVDLKDKEGRTPLHWQLSVEELLFELKFYRGCSFSLIILINQFIYHIPYSDGATVDLEGKEGRTPLHWAAVCGRTVI